MQVSKKQDSRIARIMSSFTLLTVISAIFAAHLLQVVSSAPTVQKRCSACGNDTDHKQDETGTSATGTSLVDNIPVDPTVKPSSCVELDKNNRNYSSWFDTICSKTYGYEKTLFPNPRQFNLDLQIDLPTNLKDRDPVYFRNALGEFRHFESLLASNCHYNLAPLLCSFYFPQCFDSGTEPKLVTPCKSLCEEVTHPNSSCSVFLAQHNLTWGNQWDCSGGQTTILGAPVYPEENNEDGDLCSPGYATPPPVSREPPTTEPPPTTPPMCDICPEGAEPIKGRLRVGFNSETFIRNDYNFVFKAELIEITTFQCRHAYNFTLKEQFDIKDTDNCSLAPSLAVQSNFLALGHYDSQGVPPNAPNVGDIGGLFAVAGFHKPIPVGCSGPALWDVSNGVLADWKGKYNKKLSKWVDSANQERC